MRKTKIYLDTSVISHLEHDDAPEKRADTQELWNQIKSGKYEVVISEALLDELMQAPEPKRTIFAQYLTDTPHTEVSVTDEILELAEKFINFGILRQKSLDDCRHIASAIVAGCDLIVSWNFKHIVNPKTIKGTKIITTA